MALFKEKIQNYVWKIDRKYQYSIYASIVTTFIAYIYYMVHNIHNYDSIAIFGHGVGVGVEAGRWFLNILYVAVNKLFDNGGYFHTTVINTLVAVFLVEICCLLIINIFELKTPLECIAVTVVTIAFPTIGATMLFNYTVMYYMVSAMLSTLAVWFVKKGRWYGLIAGTVCLTLGLGIYQSYFSYGGALLLILLLQQVLSEETKADMVFTNALKYFGVLVASFSIYMGITKYYLYKGGLKQLQSYQNMDQMGKINLEDLPLLICQTYQNFFSVTYQNYMGISAAGSVHFLFLALYFITTLAGILILIKMRKDVFKVIELILIFAVFPIAADSITIFASRSYIYTLMIMAMVTVFYFSIVICKGLSTRYNIQKIFCTCFCCIILCIGSFYCYQANVNYTELFYMNERTQNFFSILYSRILSQPGYESNMDIVFAGENFEELPTLKSYEIGELRYGGNSFHINSYSRDAVMEIYFGKRYREITEEEKEIYSGLLDQMKAYPDYSSIRIVNNGMLIVKIE